MPPRAEARAGAAFIAFAALVSVALIYASKTLAFVDQGDFQRAIYAFLSGPADPGRGGPFGPPVLDWAFAPEFSFPWFNFNFGSLFFFLDACVQSLYDVEFHLVGLALVSKIAVLSTEAALAVLLARRWNGGGVARGGVFLLLALTSFYAHNAGIFTSFYQEYTWFVFLPLFVLGLLSDRGRWRPFCCGAAMLFCAGSKAATFYAPALFVLADLCVAAVARSTVDRGRLAALGAAQAGALLVLLANPALKLNSYHSTYFGSYLMLTDAQREQEGVPAQDLACVGVDAWGNRLTPDWTDYTAGHRSCIDARDLRPSDVVRPYLHHPSLIARLWFRAAPGHFTVDYFHVSRTIPYLRAAGPDGFGPGRLLIAASRLRDRFVSPAYAAVLAAALVLVAVRLRRGGDAGIARLLLFLALFIPSQFVVSLVGEGVRDLSKHLAVAQFCLDLLLAFCIVEAVALLRDKRPDPALGGTGGA